MVDDPISQGIFTANAMVDRSRDYRAQRRADRNKAAAVNALASGDVARAAAYAPDLAQQYQEITGAQQEQQAAAQERQRNLALDATRAFRQARARGASPEDAARQLAPAFARFAPPEEVNEFFSLLTQNPDSAADIEAALGGVEDTDKGRYISTRGGIFDTQTREIIASPDDPLMEARREQLSASTDAARALAEQRRAAAASPAATAVQTPGRKKVDEKYADRYLDWREQGSASVAANLDRLDTAAAALESGENLTGPIIGAVTDPRVRSVYAPKSADIQQQVEEVVQQSLRAILGGQFAMKEGEQLVARAYNPRLGEKENAARVRRLVSLLENAAAAKEAQAQYFEENGTLAGWEGADVSDIRRVINAAYTGSKDDPFREAPEPAGDETEDDVYSAADAIVGGL